MSTGTGTGIDRTSVADPPLPQQEKPPGRMVSSLWRRGPFWALLAIMIVLVVLPIGMLLLASLTDSTPRPGDPVGNFTLDNFQALFSDRGIEAMVNSVLMALGAGVVAMSIGAALAWLAARSDVPARPLVQLAGIIPLFISGFVGAMAWSLVASPQSGYVNMLLRELGIDVTLNIYSLPGIIFVAGLYYSPYAFIFVYGALTLMNPELEEAASVHGATQPRVAMRVTLPMVRPALLAAGILTFALIIEDFPIPVILGAGNGIPTLPAYVYELMTVAPSDVNGASAVGMAMIVILIALIAGQRMLLRGRSYTTVSGKGFRPGQVRLRRWRWVAFAGVLAYLSLAILVPMLALLHTAVSGAVYYAGFGDLFQTDRWSTEPLVDALTTQAFTEGLINSLTAGALAALFGVALYFALAWFVNRSNIKGRRVLEHLATAPVAIPALVMGIALMWTWIVIPLPVYGTLAVLVIAYVIRFTPQGFGGISGAFQQIHSDLEAAARVSGASALRATTYVTLPLLRTSILSAALLVVVLSIRELASSIFLFTSDTRVLSVVVFGQWENGNWSRVASMSLGYSAVLLLITVVGRRWLRPA
ncbi:ABC transporter permease [Qaidamihabitans albus]|uniref:ABC transporter permease n=1 Tax=Qaidamihabitans albus TaxID=2795733 RepID=UPI0018F1FF68|nr:iron ABC transporter permease [Qaidamihabitans albus]